MICRPRTFAALALLAPTLLFSLDARAVEAVVPPSSPRASIRW